MIEFLKNGKKTAAATHKTIGYLRVSTTGQELEKNKADILRLANQNDLGRVQFVEEKISGKVSWRKRQIAGLLETLQAKDTIIVSELSRLGRNAGVHGDSFHRHTEGNQYLCSQRQLATGPEHSEQNHRDGVLNGG